MATRVKSKPKPPTPVAQEQPVALADDMGAGLIAKQYPAEKGWKNINVCGHSWRCNRWEKFGYGAVIKESYFVTLTPDGVMLRD